jgi:hypothetical protein
VSVSGKPQTAGEEQPLSALTAGEVRDPSRYAFHPYWELARLWGVAAKTIKNWVYLDRRRGLVVAGRYRLVRVRGRSRRREFLIRADAAMELFDRHIGAPLEQKFRRASPGSTPGSCDRMGVS